MHQPDEENIVFSIASGFIQKSNHPVFLTGKAGTGKTTFLKYIKETCAKNIAIVAPTGVAAINAGGTTIHSLFNLPFSPYIPVNKQKFGEPAINDKHGLFSKLRISNEKKDLFKNLELLVIDEISMVRCDVIDAIDAVLRHIRKQPARPFGGVQVLYIGDVYQLPPVAKEDEWRMLEKYYANPYFFSSKVVQEQPPVYIELEKVYRQKDFSFVDLLNKVRNNEIDEAAYALLHSRYHPSFQPGIKDNYITLTTHNNAADVINKQELEKLNAGVQSFKAIIDGIFPDSNFPCDEFLQLKKGAKVMFIKNDSEKVRRYYNGKIGTISKMETDKIFVTCTDNGIATDIEVKKETWQNIRYTFNSKSNQVEEQVQGSFTQFPLRLAWAITIHKSQGLTFEQMVVDAGRAFAPGQVYVALSRCTSLKGLILKSNISQSSLQSDERIISFSRSQQNTAQKEALLLKAQAHYEKDIIVTLFNYETILSKVKELQKWNREANVFGSSVTEWLNTLRNEVTIISNYAEKFIPVLEQLFTESESLTNNTALLSRLQKASDWFIASLDKIIVHLLACTAITDNRQKANDFTSQLKSIYEDTCLQKHLLGIFSNLAFSIDAYQQHKRKWALPLCKLNAYAGASSAHAQVSDEIAHPELFLLLKEKRLLLAEENAAPVFMICSTTSIEQMANYLPCSIKELSKISGFGPIKLKQYGEAFVSIIREYCEEKELHPAEISIPVRKTSKKKANSNKPDTKQETFKLFKQGIKPSEIATVRNLAISTIENHLAHFVETGEISIDVFVKPEKQEMIRAVLTKDIQSFTAIKTALQNDDISYGDIRCVVANEKNKQEKMVKEE